MKTFTLATTTLLLSTSTNAKMSNIQALLKDLAATQSGDPSDAATRTLSAGWANSMVESIDGYGCWCYFENDHGKGKGHAKNDVDAQCKILHDGYSCIFMDAEDEKVDGCVPWLVEYVEPTGLGWWAKTGDDEGMKNALRKDCVKKNKKGDNSWCAQKACIVEGYFSINLFNLLTSGVKYDQNLLHKRGRFDPTEECAVIKGPAAERECCGEYPIRFPYKYMPGKRECCGSATYNAEFLQCCDDKHAAITCDK